MLKLLTVYNDKLGFLKKLFALFFKGVLLGIALVIPGLSAGAVALITGVYTALITLLSSFSLAVFLDKKKNVSLFQNLFKLSPLFLGAAVGVFSSIHQVLFFIEKYPVNAYSLFSGLILSGLLFLFRKMKMDAVSLAVFFISALGAYLISWAQTGDVFISHFIWLILAVYLASVAMLFPGISGSYILMIMGAYPAVLSDVKNLSWKLMLYAFTSLFGLINSSRWVKHLLKNHYSKTLAALSGMTLGGGLGIFPMKELAGNSFNSLLFLGIGACFMLLFQYFFVEEKQI